jgi:1-deoxy-D-xylulose-5-phosphate synthase
VSILASVSGPRDLRRLSEAELAVLCGEIRDVIIETVATTGGHLGSSLGVVELTVALHRLLDSPIDHLLFDTGHQAYPHKLLTGRLAQFGTLRQLGGMGGFPRRGESPHDVFDGGHAGTGLSIGLGLAAARDLRGDSERVVVIVGDAALMSGLSLEALNDIGQRQTNMMIVLNDNEMSISPTVGAISTYLSAIKLSAAWQTTKAGYDAFLERMPVVGPTAVDLSRRARKSVVNFAQQPGRLFEDLGITYIGVVPGHNLPALLSTFRRALRLDGPVIVHVRTQKGHGYRPAERDQVGFHGAALPPMLPRDPGGADNPSVDGPAAARPASPTNGDGDATPPARVTSGPASPPSYTAVAVAELMEIAAHDDRVVAITAGMPTGTGLHRFQAAYPGRFFDVGIAEPHAVTFAAGLAIGGRRPFVAVYSTFLQRAFDQVVHDVCQNDLPVVIGVDRAGLVGEDGTSHQGMFTIPAQRQLPNLVIASPRDELELRRLVRAAFAQDHPFAIHYPRDPGLGLVATDALPMRVGEAEVLREGSDLLFVGFGPIVQRALEAAAELERGGWSVEVIDARFVAPLDVELIVREARGKRLVTTVEESIAVGGLGSAVLEALARAGIDDAAVRAVPVHVVGIPAGAFVDHGAVAELRRHLRLDTPGLVAQVREVLARLDLEPVAPATRLSAVRGAPGT